MIKSERICLRPLEPSDIDFLYKWENDTSLWQYGDTIAPLSKHLIADYVTNYDIDIYKAKQLRLMIQSNTDNSIIGTIDIYNLEIFHQRAYLGILIAPDYRNKGYATEAINSVLQYAKNILGLRQMVAYVSIENILSIKLFENCGFIQNGILKQWHRIGTKFHDVKILQILF